MTLQRMLLVLLLIGFMPGSVLAHGKFQWIKDRPSWAGCCGVNDCGDVIGYDGNTVTIRTESGATWTVTITPATRQYDSPDGHGYACGLRNSKARCYWPPNLAWRNPEPVRTLLASV